jgi:NADH-quinone oxidoreductase subunit J
VGAIVAGVMVLELAYVIWFRSDGLPVDEQLVPKDAAYSSTEQLGQVLYTQYLYPFELAAMLLLLAIVAAILLTMRQRPGLKIQDVTEQVKVRREDRVRIVKMKSESE